MNAIATLPFQKFVIACEVFKGDEWGNDYHYLLDHSEEYDTSYFYYRHTMLVNFDDIRRSMAITVYVTPAIQ